MMKYFFCSLFLFLSLFSKQVLKAQTLTLAHYNVENLFDTIDDPRIQDEEFLPTAEKAWTAERYAHKLELLASVIAQLGDADGPEWLGLCEVENAAVVNDLLKHKKLQKHKYQLVHFDSPDERGIDVAFVYKKGHLKKVKASAVNIIDPSDSTFKTRNILLVSGRLKNGQAVHFLVNHWPSRWGGKEKSEPKRILAAQTARKIIDSLQQSQPKAVVFVLGDLNDGASDSSVLQVLGSDSLQGPLYNPFFALEKAGEGSIVYRGQPEQIDHILFTQNLLQSPSKLQYIRGSAAVFKADFIREAEGRFKGNPWRTYAGNRYLAGYSDHFPVYLHLKLPK